MTTLAAYAYTRKEFEVNKSGFKICRFLERKELTDAMLQSSVNSVKKCLAEAFGSSEMETVAHEPEQVSIHPRAELRMELYKEPPFDDRWTHGQHAEANQLYGHWRAVAVGTAESGAGVGAYFEPAPGAYLLRAGAAAVTDWAYRVNGFTFVPFIPAYADSTAIVGTLVQAWEGNEWVTLDHQRRTLWDPKTVYFNYRGFLQAGGRNGFMAPWVEFMTLRRQLTYAIWDYGFVRTFHRPASGHAYALASLSTETKGFVVVRP